MKLTFIAPVTRRVSAIPKSKSFINRSITIPGAHGSSIHATPVPLGPGFLSTNSMDSSSAAQLFRKKGVSLKITVMVYERIQRAWRNGLLLFVIAFILRVVFDWHYGTFADD